MKNYTILYITIIALLFIVISSTAAYCFPKPDDYAGSDDGEVSEDLYEILYTFRGIDNFYYDGTSYDIKDIHGFPLDKHIFSSIEECIKARDILIPWLQENAERYPQIKKYSNKYKQTKISFKLECVKKEAGDPGIDDDDNALITQHNNISNQQDKKQVIMFTVAYGLYGDNGFQMRSDSLRNNLGLARRLNMDNIFNTFEECERARVWFHNNYLIDEAKQQTYYIEQNNIQVRKRRSIPSINYVIPKSKCIQVAVDKEEVNIDKDKSPYGVLITAYSRKNDYEEFKLVGKIIAQRVPILGMPVYIGKNECLKEGKKNTLQIKMAVEEPTIDIFDLRRKGLLKNVKFNLECIKLEK